MRGCRSNGAGMRCRGKGARNCEAVSRAGGGEREAAGRAGFGLARILSCI